jgi:alpha-methylacyl-CoA racemase
MMLAFGMLGGILHAQRTGEGLVVDAAMTEGSALLMSMMWGFRAAGRWPGERGTNLLDGGAPFYDTYSCADGKYVAVGAIEPQFYAALRTVMALDGAEWDAPFDRDRWPALKAALAERFRARSRDAWCAAFAGHDACVAPVLGWDEAPADPHNVARGAFVTVEGVVQPAPAPRFAGRRDKDAV